MRAFLLLPWLRQARWALLLLLDRRLVCRGFLLLRWRMFVRLWFLQFAQVTFLKLLLP